MSGDQGYPMRERCNALEEHDRVLRKARDNLTQLEAAWEAAKQREIEATLELADIELAIERTKNLIKPAVTTPSNSPEVA